MGKCPRVLVRCNSLGFNEWPWMSPSYNDKSVFSFQVLDLKMSNSIFVTKRTTVIS